MEQLPTNNDSITIHPIWPFGVIVDTEEIKKRNENLIQDIKNQLWKEILSDIQILSQYLTSSKGEYAKKFFQWLQQRNIKDLTETCEYFQQLPKNTDLWMPQKCIAIFTAIKAII